MTIRFLQPTDSQVPGVPFVPGQVITVDQPWPELLRCLDGVRAEVVPDTEPEMAVARAPRTRKASTRSAR